MFELKTISIEKYDDLKVLVFLQFLNQTGGLLVDDGATSPSKMLQMLMGKRGRFAFYHDLGIQRSIEDLALESKIRMLPPTFYRYDHYIAFSKNTPEDVIGRVQKALDRLDESGELFEIRSKYYRIDE